MKLSEFIEILTEELKQYLAPSDKVESRLDHQIDLESRLFLHVLQITLIELRHYGLQDKDKELNERDLAPLLSLLAVRGDETHRETPSNYFDNPTLPINLFCVFLAEKLTEALHPELDGLPKRNQILSYLFPTFDWSKNNYEGPLYQAVFKDNGGQLIDVAKCLTGAHDEMGASLSRPARFLDESGHQLSEYELQRVIESSTHANHFYKQMTGFMRSSNSIAEARKIFLDEMKVIVPRLDTYGVEGDYQLRINIKEQFMNMMRYYTPDQRQHLLSHLSLVDLSYIMLGILPSEMLFLKQLNKLLEAVSGMELSEEDYQIYLEIYQDLYKKFIQEAKEPKKKALDNLTICINMELHDRDCQVHREWSNISKEGEMILGCMDNFRKLEKDLYWHIRPLLPNESKLKGIIQTHFKSLDAIAKSFHHIAPSLQAKNVFLELYGRGLREKILDQPFNKGDDYRDIFQKRLNTNDIFKQDPLYNRNVLFLFMFDYNLWRPLQGAKTTSLFGFGFGSSLDSKMLAADFLLAFLASDKDISQYNDFLVQYKKDKHLDEGQMGSLDRALTKGAMKTFVDRMMEVLHPDFRPAEVQNMREAPVPLKSGMGK